MTNSLNKRSNPRNDRRLRESWESLDNPDGRRPPTPGETATRIGLMLAIAFAIGVGVDMAFRLTGG